VLPVAIVTPAAAVPQAATRQGAAPPGGVFAALFAALTDGPAIEHADPPATPKGDGGANIVALLQGATAGAASPAEPDGGEAPAATKDGDGPDDRATMIAPRPLPLAVAPATGGPEATPASATEVPPPAPAEIPSPLLPATTTTTTTVAAPSLLAPVTQQPATVHEGAPAAPQVAAPNPLADGNAIPPASKESASPLPLLPLVSAQTQNGEPVALVLPFATTSADAPSQTAPSAQIAPYVKPSRATADTNTSAAPPPVTDDSTADAEVQQLQPATQAKKPAPAASEAKLAANNAKPKAVQTSGGNTGNIFITSATPDAAMPLPIADAAGQVKMVQLSNLASLPNGAAVTAIGAVIASEAAAGTSRFLIRLDPPELGRIDVRLRFGRDGEVHARLIADRPETVSLLMRDAATLERALNASGMRTADGIDVMLRDSSGGFARTDGGPGGDRPAAPPYHAPVIAADSLSGTPAWIRPSLAGRIDLTV
jgi:flagellar hook-length control protein FliK